MEPDCAQRVVAILAWRRGSVMALGLSGILVTIGWLTLASGLVALGLAACLLGGSQLALQSALRECVLCSELTGLRVVARYRRRLCSAQHRRSLAAAAEAMALGSEQAKGCDFVQWDRVRRVAGELRALAKELEAVPSVDPRTILDVDRLLCDGRASPLLNPEMPDAETRGLLLSIRFRLQTATFGAASEPSGAPKMGRSTDGGLAAVRVPSGWLARHAPVNRRRFR